MSFEPDLPCKDCPWVNFDISLEDERAIKVYDHFTAPVSRLPIGRDLAQALLGLDRMTRQEAQGLWDRLNFIESFLREASEEEGKGDPVG